MSGFNNALNQLARDARNRDLHYAISSWSKVISELGDFDALKIEDHAYKWLRSQYIVTSSFKFYKQILLVTNSRFMLDGLANKTLENISEDSFKTNIQKTTSNMETIIILLIGFMLAAIGLVLLMFNNQQNISKNRNIIIKNNDVSFNQFSKVEKYILVLLIKSDRYQELIHSLENNSNNRRLQLEDSSKLYGATQGLWIGEKSKFDRTQINQKLINCSPVSNTSEYDVHFVKIELDENDDRFYHNVNPMDRRDAFIELGKRSPQITVSDRLPCKAYENTEFYSR